MLKKVRLILAFVSLSVCLCFMSSTYSRYVAGAASNIDGSFAKWQILVNDSDITGNANSTMTFTPTIDENQYVASNVVAPSSKGHFDVNIDPSNVEVSFKYSITLGIANETMPDLKITGYSIVPNDYVEGTPLDIVSLNDTVIASTLNFDKNTPSFKFESFTIRVYFEWYEGINETMDDNADTLVGKNAAINNTTFSMTANLAFEQVIE